MDTQTMTSIVNTLAVKLMQRGMGEGAAITIAIERGATYGYLTKAEWAVVRNTMSRRYKGKPVAYRC